MRELQEQITQCARCPRLTAYIQDIAQNKKAAHRTETYWGKPVPGFGDPRARLMIIGLAPAAHGALRTGRVFTGDRSGEWLYRELFQYGFSNHPESTHLNDSLQLRDAYISCVTRCAPPQNKPLPEEIKNCLPFLQEEIRLLRPYTRVYLVLGQIALQGTWNALQIPSEMQKRPTFSHGSVTSLPGGTWLIQSFHPSQQNTFTGKLTAPMWSQIFRMCREYL